MDLPFLLAQAVTPVSNSACNNNTFGGITYSSDAIANLQNNAVVAQNVAQGWTCQWNNLVVNPGSSIVGPVFQQMAEIGTIFAVATSAWFVLQWAQDLNDNRDPSNAISRLLWPVIVAIFLGNNGYLLALSAHTIRDWVANVDQKMLAQVSGALTLQQAYQYEMNYGPGKQSIESIVANCAVKPANERARCMYGTAPTPAPVSGQPTPPPKALTADTALPNSPYDKLKKQIDSYQSAPMGQALGGYVSSIVS